MDYKEANRSVVDIYLTKEYWKPEYQDLFAKDFVLDLPSAPPGMPQHMDAFDARQYREWLLRTVSGYTSEVQAVSYTHLDVYKRQDCSTICSADGSLSGRSSSGCPVHLQTSR